MRHFRLISFLCWFVYVSAYFGRVNLSIGLPYLQEAYGFSKALLGMAAGGFFTAYAAGQLVNGILGDRFNPRYFVGFGLLCAGISNILFGSSRQFWAVFCFWTMNGYFQSMLWGPLMRIISDVSPEEHLHKTTLFFSSSTVCGYFLSYSLLGKIAAHFGWKSAFYIPGVMLLFASAAWFFSLRRYSGKSVPNSGGRWIMPLVFRRGLWIAALVCILQGSIKEGLTLWGPVFFSEVRMLPMDTALLIMFFVPATNLAALGAGGLVYRKFRYQEKYTMAFFLTSALIAAVALRASVTGMFAVMTASIAALSMSIFAVNNILTAFMPLHFHKERKVSAVAGFLDCSVYIGAALSGPLAGFLADHFGWPGVINGWIAICVAGIAAALSCKDYRKEP